MSSKHEQNIEKSKGIRNVNRCNRINNAKKIRIHRSIEWASATQRNFEDKNYCDSKENELVLCRIARHLQPMLFFLGEPVEDCSFRAKRDKKARK